MVNEILEFIDVDYQDNGFYVKEFTDNLYFGKDKDTNLVCLKKNSSNGEQTKVKTDYIELFQNIEATIILNNKNKLTDRFDVIVCKSDNSNNKETFIRLCLGFYNCKKESDVINLTKNLIELFRISSVKDVSIERGLWGELFSIYYIYNNYNIDISSSWHSDFYLKYDFSFNDNNKMETKATIKPIRIHRFSHEQLYTNHNILISSVMMRKDDNGLTVLDLFEKIKELFVNDYAKLMRYEKQIRKMSEELEKYDESYSRENIKFYLNNEIPRFSIKEPEGVSNTSYDVDLSNIEGLNQDRIIRILGE